MEFLTNNLQGLANFAIYFGISVGFLLVFKYASLAITKYDEWQLIKEQNNSAAAVALSGSLIGYALAISGVATSSIDFVDFAVWGVVAAITQFAAVFIVSKVFMPQFTQRIENNELPAAIVAAAFYVSIGLLNAACMSY